MPGSYPAREARLRAGISVEKAARHLRWSRSHFLAIERGEAPLPLHKADRMARLYGCGVLDLTRGTASITDTRSDERWGEVAMGEAGSATRLPRRGKCMGPVDPRP